MEKLIVRAVKQKQVKVTVDHKVSECLVIFDANTLSCAGSVVEVLTMVMCDK